MHNSILIFTATFSAYDIVLPPIKKTPNADYVIITNDESMQVPGWTVKVVDVSNFSTDKEANLYYRALIHEILLGYDISIYVDGNIRILNDLTILINDFAESDADVSLHRHPQRDFVYEELGAVIQKKPKLNAVRLINEVEQYFADGLPEKARVIDTGVIFKKHASTEMKKTMSLWYETYSVTLTRDQLSFPYVIWKTGLNVKIMQQSLDGQNIYFRRYPHYSVGRSLSWSYVCARSMDSNSFYCILLVLKIHSAILNASKTIINRFKKI
jgi:hypothetical protein